MARMKLDKWGVGTTCVPIPTPKNMAHCPVQYWRLIGPDSACLAPLVSAGTPQAVSAGLCLFLPVQLALMKFLKFHGDRLSPVKLVLFFSLRATEPSVEAQNNVPMFRETPSGWW